MNLPTVTSLTTSARSLGYGATLRPQRDWLLLLLLAGVLVIASVGWNLWLFAQASSGQVIGEGVVLTEPKPLDLAATRRTLEARAAERERYLASYRFVDPALGGAATVPASLTPSLPTATLE